MVVDLIKLEVELKNKLQKDDPVIAHQFLNERVTKLRVTIAHFKQTLIKIDELRANNICTKDWAYDDLTKSFVSLVDLQGMYQRLQASIPITKSEVRDDN